MCDRQMMIYWLFLGSAAPRTRKGAPYQVFDHGFDLFLGHVYILCGAFQGDLVLTLCELDVHLPQQNQERDGQDGTVAVPSQNLWSFADAAANPNCFM